MIPMIPFKCEPGLVPVTLASLRVKALVFRGIQGPESCRLLPAITCHPPGLMSPSRPFAHLAPATPASSLLCRLRLLSRLGASPLPLPLAAPRAPTGPRFQPHPTRQACPGGPPAQPGTHSRLPSRYSWLWGIVTLCSVAVCRPRAVSPQRATCRARRCVPEAQRGHQVRTCACLTQRAHARLRIRLLRRAMPLPGGQSVVSGRKDVTVIMEEQRGTGGGTQTAAWRFCGVNVSRGTQKRMSKMAPRGRSGNEG